MTQKWPYRVCVLAVVTLLLLLGNAAVDLARDDVAGHDPSVRETTGRQLVRTGTVESDIAGKGPAQVARARQAPLASYQELAESDSDWILVDLDSFLTYIPVGQACAIRFDNPSDSLTVIAPALPLTDLACQAIDYAPGWLEMELRDAFARLGSSYQDTYAGIVLGAADPVVDEIAFVVAHTSPQVLRSANFYTGLLTENAEDVYAHDPYLDYVDIVDYGTAVAGGDYYSTVRYRTAETGDTVEIELPRDRYYWDIVHLKVTDELPTYIDPSTGYIQNPPLGRFWREFLFTASDSGYPALRDELAGCQVLWDGNVDSRTNGAIGIMTQWILDVMDFGSGAERPIQPVRIYRKHLGRCGEHADITCAAARAALIPTNSPLAMASDHTWNEFYDQRWVHWEPVNVYVDSPWHYEGWGKEFLGIFNWRGDDWVWTVTERYTPHCTLTVAVTDSVGYPIDGAQVTIARFIGGLTYYEATWASTDHTGTCQFLLGDNNDIYARIDSDLGTVPPGPLYKMAADSSAPDSHYVWNKFIKNHRPQLPVLPASLPPAPQDLYRMEMTWEVESQFCYGLNRLDDNQFSDRMDGGSVGFFICDEANYTAYALSDSFDAYEIMQDADSARVGFTFPEYGKWYTVLSNEEHVVNTQIVRGTVALYQRPFARVADGGGESNRLRLAQNEPNPFGSATRIGFVLPQDNRAELAVYDVKGRWVTTLLSGHAAAGDHLVRWDGRDSRGEAVAPGVYLYRLKTPERTISRKMVIMR